MLNYYHSNDILYSNGLKLCIVTIKNKNNNTNDSLLSNYMSGAAKYFNWTITLTITQQSSYYPSFTNK